MATAVAAGNQGVCSSANATRESVSRTNADGTDIRTSNIVLSETINLRLPYATQECNVT